MRRARKDLAKAGCKGAIHARGVSICRCVGRAGAAAPGSSGDLVQGEPPRASSFRSDHLGSPEPGWRALPGLSGCLPLFYTPTGCTSTNISWTQHGQRIDIKGVYAPANHWILLVFLARCRTKTFGVRPKEGGKTNDLKSINTSRTDLRGTGQSDPFVGNHRNSVANRE